MSKDTYPHLQALRELMRSKNVDAVIIPGTDPHQSEYPAECWKYRDYVTGFTGSNGTAVVTLKEAGLWTDSRYFLQAEEQLQGSGFTLHKENIPGQATITEWLAQTLDDESIVAIDGRLFSLIEANRLENWCGDNGFMLATDFYPADLIWEGRPPRPAGVAQVYPVEFDGEDVESKIQRTLQAVEQAGADCMLVTALDDIAWLLNLRGTDVAYTPVVTAYAFIAGFERVIFIDSHKVTDEVKKHLREHDVKIKDYDDVLKYLEKVKEHHTILLDPNRVSDTLGQSLLCQKVYTASPIQALKAVKNQVQIEGTRQAMIHDGVAMTRMFRWLEQNVATGNLTELDVDRRLQQERAAASDTYRGDSFHMIAGYKQHGAIVHYEADEQSAATLQPIGLLLIDTGGQYLEGTTDVTRTLSLGNPTPEERHDYTLVLKAHLRLARAVFPAGTVGNQLDVLAHGILWQEGQNYLHGTGHGVGHYLGVHEGPMQIRMSYIPAELEPGMVTSDEPGIYKAGQYGIRIENLLLVVPAMQSQEFGQFYRFEPLTLYPYDLSLIDRSMLSPQDIEQINAYHQHVLELLTPHLTPDEAQWLQTKCQQL